MSMNLTLIRSALAPLALLMATHSQAHFFAESPNCREPLKPLEFVTEQDQQAFQSKVSAFRACLETFVGKQNEAMSKHQQAAEKAATKWKNYAENVLGATLTSETSPADAKQ